MARIDANALLTDIAPNAIGKDLTYSATYDEIKQARYEENPELSQGVWQRDVAKADWQKVQLLAADAIQHKSKDLQLVAWLVEALMASDSFDGLADGIKILDEFLKKYGATCYPLNDGKSDDEQKQRILAWLYDAARKRLQLAAIFGQFRLYDYNYALQNSDQSAIDDINTAAQAMTEDEAKALKTKVSKLRAAINQLAIDGAFSKVLTDLDQIETFFKKSNEPILEHVAESKLSKRDEIYLALEMITSQLEKLEKHSPSPYLLRLVISWKDKSLLEIMNDLHTGTTPPHKLLKILVG